MPKIMLVVWQQTKVTATIKRLAFLAYGVCERPLITLTYICLTVTMHRIQNTLILASAESLFGSH